MKLSLAVTTAILASLGLALPATSDVSARGAIAARAANPSATGLQFTIDGKTGYFAGTNSYWISYLQNTADVDLVMSHLSTSGLKILRVWGFNDIKTSSADVWFQSFVPGQAAVINTGANGLGRLDQVVKSAEKYGIKLIIPFVNYWDDYGGMAAYNQWAGVSTKTEWYTNAKVQTQYKAFVKAVVNRYKSSSAIFAWELANEVRCPGCSTDVIYKWATDISAYVKSLDSGHMVTLGDEGFMDGGGDGSYPFTKFEGVDFVKNLKIKDLDFGTFHLYPDAWGTSPDWGNLWVKEHAAACVAAGKPCLFEEYGYPTDHIAVETPWQKTSLATNGMASDLFWQHGDVLSTGKTHDDTNTIYYGSAEWDGLVVEHQKRIAIKNGGGNGGTNPVPPPVSSPAATPKPTTTTTKPVATPTANPGPTVPKWGQCGGQEWTGSKVCVAGTVCTFNNQWYSQCL